MSEEFFSELQIREPTVGDFALDWALARHKVLEQIKQREAAPVKPGQPSSDQLLGALRDLSDAEWALFNHLKPTVDDVIVEYGRAAE